MPLSNVLWQNQMRNTIWSKKKPINFMKV